MSAWMVLVLVEGLLAMVLAWRSPRRLVGLSCGVWAAHLVVTLLVFWFPAGGAWAGLMGGASPGRLLTVAATVLALLLFTANFFHGVAKPDKDAERYFDRVLDTYLSTRSGMTRVLFTESFNVMILALFVLPVCTPWLQDWPAAHAAVMAAWCGCLALVFGVLLVNATTVLRGSLRRLVGRESIRWAIRNEIKDGFDHNIAELVRDPQRWDGHGFFAGHLTAMAVMPVEQQQSYFDHTLGSWACTVLLNNRVKQARRLIEPGRRSTVMVLRCKEWAHGNFGNRADQATSILRAVDGMQRARVTAIGAGVASFEDPGVQAQLLRTLTHIGVQVDNHYDTLGRHRGLAASWRRDELGMGRFTAWTGIGGLDAQGTNNEDEQLLHTTAECFRQVIDFHFPEGQPSQCSPTELRELARDLQHLHHVATREALMSLFAQRAVRATITRRAEDETLDIDTLRRTFPRPARRSVQDPSPRRPHEKDSWRAALYAAMFQASVDAQDMPETSRAELLKWLDITDTVTSLIYQLQYQHRSHKSIPAALLRPYARQLEYRPLGDEINDVDHEQLHDFLHDTIGYFSSRTDIEWLFGCLDLPADANFVVQYQQHIHSDLPLSTALLWRGTAGTIGYTRATSTALPESIPPYQQDQFATTLNRAADILNDVRPGQGDWLLLNNPWATQE